MNGILACWTFCQVCTIWYRDTVLIPVYALVFLNSHGSQCLSLKTSLTRLYVETTAVGITTQTLMNLLHVYHHVKCYLWSCSTDDGTLIVTTEYNGTYFLYQGIYIAIYTPYTSCAQESVCILCTCTILPSPPSDGSYTLVLDKSVVIGQVVVAHKHHLLLFRTGQLLRDAMCIVMVLGKQLELRDSTLPHAPFAIQVAPRVIHSLHSYILMLCNMFF